MSDRADAGDGEEERLLRVNDRVAIPRAELDVRVPRLRTRFYAFLSYSHKDKDLADWLHRELEEFRVPHSLAGKLRMSHSSCLSLRMP